MNRNFNDSIFTILLAGKLVVLFIYYQITRCGWNLFKLISSLNIIKSVHLFMFIYYEVSRVHVFIVVKYDF